MLGIALVAPRAVFTIPAAAAFSTFAIPHFFFHLNHLHHATSGEAVFLTTANAVVALLGLLVIVLTLVRDARHRQSAKARRLDVRLAAAGWRSMTEIRTPDQRLRVFVSSTMNELADARVAARRGIEQLHLTPVMFELGARPIRRGTCISPIWPRATSSSRSTARATEPSSRDATCPGSRTSSSPRRASRN